MVQIIDPQTAGTVTVIEPPASGEVSVVEPAPAGDVEIVNAQGKVETSPETAQQQEIAGVPKAPVEEVTPAPTTVKEAAEVPAPGEKTNREDVLANFKKFLGRDATSEEDLKNVDFLTTLDPAEVERRLREEGDKIKTEVAKEEELPEAPEPTPEAPEVDQAKQDAIDTINSLIGSGDIKANDSRFWKSNPDFQENLRKLASGELDVADVEETPEEKEKTLADEIADIRARGAEEVKAIQARLDEAKATLNDSQQAVIDSVKETFDRRILQQEQINKALLAGERVRGFQSGRARFSSTLQAQLLSNEESAGIARIADLESQKTAALTEAQLKIAENDLLSMNAELEKFERLQQEQVDELILLNQIATQEEQRQFDRMRAIRDEERQDISLGLSIEALEQEKLQDERQFALENEDRIAGSVASGLVELSNDLEIIRPSEADIIAFAEQLGVSPLTLTREINARIDELRKVAKDERGTRLNELKFEETKSQNEIANELNERQLAISAGRLSLAREQASKVDANGKRPTASQFKAGGFATRLNQANNIFDTTDQDTLDKLTSKISIARNLPDRFKSSELKQVEQAERNFINAILRRESGSAIGADEFESAALQYFPQPGDDSSVLEQKRQNRLLVEQNITEEAGAAFSPLGNVDDLINSLSPEQRQQLIDEGLL